MQPGDTLHPFDAPTLPPLAEVGGKGLSLARMARAGLAVPPGFVLGVSFFAPWFAALESTDAWRVFLDAPAESLGPACDALKRETSTLRFDDAQREAVQRALEKLPAGLFAVRSSSPEEDLDGSSFAGGYETVLGVTPAGIEDAVRRAFASCLDVRVAVYKREHGFDLRRPRIAVVVQRQIASEVAGVGFSVDPLDNDHDVAVFNANWGLGETVVSGLASPDLFRVDKLSRAVLTRQTGAKETAYWLTPSGGTVERPDDRRDTLTLTDAQVLALTEQIVGIEALYGKPMDIEWAFADGALYLLQARPITTHLALPDDLVTAPGARRRLYVDATVSVQGLLKPVSPAGSDLFAYLLRQFTVQVVGYDASADLDHALVFSRHGRLYINLSTALAFVELDTVANILGNIDPVLAETLHALDKDAYRSETVSRSVPWRVLFQLPAKALEVLDAHIDPAHARAEAQRHFKTFEDELRALDRDELNFVDFARAFSRALVERVMLHFVPAFAPSKLAMSQIRKDFADAPDDLRARIEHLDRSLPGNVTVEMGLALAALTAHIPAESTVESLEASLVDGSAPRAFVEAWRDFLARYGHRGVGELDPATPRYRESPRVLLQQVVQAATAPETHRAETIYARSTRERDEAREALAAWARGRSWLAHKRFEARARMVEHLGGLRETPKFHIIQGVDIARRRMLRAGEGLVAAGRLDRVEQVFDLHLQDIDEALANPSFDARARGAEHHQRRIGLERARELPRLIDSRGRIPRPPPRPLREGEVAGHPVSAGVVRGVVKVLHTPDEKPLLPGEVLVTRATDPGWTPLFVNAAAVVLEVGGMMQHGALVAREYGKPCVVGVHDATGRLRDGMRVEVDGAAGVVRILDDATA